MHANRIDSIARDCARAALAHFSLQRILIGKRDELFPSGIISRRAIPIGTVLPLSAGRKEKEERISFVRLLRISNTLKVERGTADRISDFSIFQSPSITAQ